jgi:hypothetical protein
MSEVVPATPSSAFLTFCYRLGYNVGRLQGIGISVKRCFDRLEILKDFRARKVIVSHFSWCNCNDESYPRRHLKISMKKVRLGQGKAAAISYAVGDFDRRLHVFGHTNDPLSTAIELTFGGEWEVFDLQASLVKLSDKYGSLWLDQLSISPIAPSIAAELESIPVIYSTFEVVIMLPTAPCPCLKVALRACQGQIDQGENLDITDIPDACFNASPISSYHFRLWCRREFAVAKSVSVHYCSPPLRKCFRDLPHSTYRPIRLSSEEFEYLGKWAKWRYSLWLQMAKDQGADDPNDSAWEMLYTDYYEGMRHMLQELFTFHVKKNQRDALNYTQTTIAGWINSFLNGQQLERHDDTDEASAMFSYPYCTFLVTVQKDLVFSIMPALRDYVVPSNWMEVTLGQLAEDGISQFEARRDILRITRLPQGLFQTGPGSMRCKPSLYIDPERVRNLGDLFGSIMTENDRCTVGSAGWIMLKVLHPTRFPSRMARTMTYKSAFGERSTSKALQFIRKIHKNVPGGIDTLKRPVLLTWAQRVLWGNAVMPREGWPTPAHGKAMFLAVLYKDREWGDFPEADHESLVFEVMCDFVNIHPDVAREKGLGLIVGTGDEPCMGLASKALYEKLNTAESSSHSDGVKCEQDHAHQRRPLDGDEFITILVNRPWRAAEFVHPRPWAVEAMCVVGQTVAGDLAEPRKPEAFLVYEACAVWYPSNPDDTSITAEVTDSWEECGGVIW